MKDFFAVTKKKAARRSNAKQEMMAEPVVSSDFSCKVEPILAKPFSSFGARTAQEVIYIKGERLIAWEKDAQQHRYLFVCGEPSGEQSQMRYKLTGRQVPITPKENTVFTMSDEEFNKLSFTDAASFFLDRHEVATGGIVGANWESSHAQARRIAIQRDKADFHRWLVQTQKDALKEMQEED